MESLKWKEHKETVVDHAFELLHTNKLTDCALSADGRKIQAHRCVLAAASSYFLNMFTSVDSENPVVFMQELSFADILNVLEFIYTGSLKMASSQINHFIAVTKNLGLVGVPDLSSNVKVEKNIENMEDTEIELEFLGDSPPLSPLSDPNYSPAVESLKIAKALRRKRKSHKAGFNLHQCLFCSSSYATRHSIYNHQRFCYLNPDRKISRCSICAIEVRPGSMLYHKKRYHNYQPQTQ